MARPRRFLFLSLAAVVVGLAVGLWLLWPRTAITLENATHLREGMTRREVEAILGGPARNEATGPVTIEAADATTLMLFTVLAEPVHVINLHDQVDPPSVQTWKSNEALVSVAFAPDERVLRLVAVPVHRMEESPLDMLRRWLGL